MYDSINVGQIDRAIAVVEKMVVMLEGIRCRSSTIRGDQNSLGD
jgi:hypothetical protein